MNPMISPIFCVSLFVSCTDFKLHTIPSASDFDDIPSQNCIVLGVLHSLSPMLYDSPVIHKESTNDSSLVDTFAGRIALVIRIGHRSTCCYWKNMEMIEKMM